MKEFIYLALAQVAVCLRVVVLVVLSGKNSPGVCTYKQGCEHENRGFSLEYHILVLEPVIHLVRKFP